jgi:hypothetical protein
VPGAVGRDQVGLQLADPVVLDRELDLDLLDALDPADLELHVKPIAELEAEPGVGDVPQRSPLRKKAECNPNDWLAFRSAHVRLHSPEGETNPPTQNGTEKYTHLLAPASASHARTRWRAGGRAQENPSARRHGGGGRQDAGP